MITGTAIVATPLPVDGLEVEREMQILIGTDADSLAP